MMALPPLWTVALLAALASAASGYWAGDHNRNNAWLAKQLSQERAWQQAKNAEAARAQAAQQQAAQQQQALQTSYSTLEGKFNALLVHGPLLVARGITVAGDGADSGRTGAGVLAPAAAVAIETADPMAADAPAAGAAAGAGTGLGISLGAVWMWNSALLGTDAPAGACSAADPASAACATDAGLGVADAWANHAANAKSCALDRLRQQQLIDFVTGYQTP